MNIDLSHIKNKKIAFVCSGGVTKAAAWHLGVSLALDELGFQFINNDNFHSDNPLKVSTYVASSAGAIVTTCLASGLNPHEAVEHIMGIKSSDLKEFTYKIMLSLKSPKKKPPKSKFFQPFDNFPPIIRHLLRPLSNFTGFFSTSGIANYMSENILISDNFEDYAADLFIVATQLDHSRKVIFGKYKYPNPTHDSTATYYTGIPVSQAAAASMTVPPFYSPYPINNPQTNKIDYYIDGEIRETLSTHVAFDNNCEVVISSWTHTPYHYQDEIGSLINYGLPAIAIQSIYLLIQKKIVASRARRENAKDIIDSINDYMKSQRFSNTQRRHIVGILERKLNYKANVKLIDIYPKHSNYELFFMNHFSINPKIVGRIVKMGHERTMEVFQNKEWLQ